MPSLFHTLNIGSEALYATRQGVDTTGHNIANAQTAGYSRQRVNLTPRHPLDINNLIIGNGVLVKDITRSHDNFIEKQINVANQDLGKSRARADAMKTIEVVFSPELAASPSDELTSFFNSLADLAAFPEDFTVRTSTVESAKNLCSSFHRVDADLKDHRLALNEKIMHTTEMTSQKLHEIAGLNVKILTLEAGQGEAANDLRDARDKLLREVSQDIDVHYYEDRFGMLMVRGPKEVTLVEGGNASSLGVMRNDNNDGMYDIVCTDWEGRKTTTLNDAIKEGSISGLLEVRDQEIPHLLEKNNEMAASLIENFNEIHRRGFGIKSYAENQGRDFFRTPQDVNTAAEEIDLDDIIYESVEAISAASSPQAPGDNVIANNLLRLKDLRILDDGNSTLQEAYSNYVGALGLTAVRADHVLQANELLITDLNARREAVSGVSLDEEATNLLRWQTCFTANSKVITTVDEMLETVLSLKR